MKSFPPLEPSMRDMAQLTIKKRQEKGPQEKGPDTFSENVSGPFSCFSC
jgi:hypothetical protein